MTSSAVSWIAEAGAFIATARFSGESCAKVVSKVASTAVMMLLMARSRSATSTPSEVCGNSLPQNPQS